MVILYADDDEDDREISFLSKPNTIGDGVEILKAVINHLPHFGKSDSFI